MKTIYSYFLLYLFISIFIFPAKIFSQWSTDPSVNMTICDTAGEQALTKNAPTSDGGCYISWFDTRGGGNIYAVYLQKLDYKGNKEFPPNGLLISNNPQKTSLVDYDLQVDKNDNAILAFTDIRNGSQINPFAYKISPKGEFLWGPNGVTLGDNSSIFQPNPKIACTSDGYYYFVWIYESTPQRQIAIQKLDASGVKQFTPAAVYLISPTSSENYDWPWPVPSDNGNIILLWSGYVGSFLSAVNYHLYSQKFDAHGSPVWNSTVDTVYSLGNVSGYYTPRIFSDGKNGAVYCWQDSRPPYTSISNCYVQRQDSSGKFLFPLNGSIVATTISNVLRYAPMAAVMSSTNETFVYWQQKNGGQTLIGIYGQKFDPNGNPLWAADQGIKFKAMDQNSFSSLVSIVNNTTVYTFYNETLFSNNAIVKGFANDTSGNMTWPGTGIVTIGSSASSKIRMWACMTTSGMCVLSWEDLRNDIGGIYAQNIYLDGSMPVELSSFTSTVSGNSVILNWSTASEKNNKGFNVEKRVNNYSWQTIGFISGNGTSTEKHNFSFSDKNLSAGNYEYRLKQIDYDGSATWSQSVEVKIGIPSAFTLLQNYPNPFNPATKINYSLPYDSKVTLEVYNITGGRIIQLVNEEQSAGYYSADFNSSLLNRNISSGVYFYKITAIDKATGNNFSSIKKMILLK